MNEKCFFDIGGECPSYCPNSVLGKECPTRKAREAGIAAGEAPKPAMKDLLEEIDKTLPESPTATESEPDQNQELPEDLKRVLAAHKKPTQTKSPKGTPRAPVASLTACVWVPAGQNFKTGCGQITDISPTSVWNCPFCGRETKQQRG